ncbi:putative cholesterol 24-hydroxylase [Apostichopus japonicus]|uniref:Putative cholesterol 24-hydroxylase n=1 Tax=Stichopus japonicus TaxID=307972 RepID=A0A2G8L7M2_STIJA|nr:putative cholesterol 24-hydroxylase [Apostichopus japonicus]
MSVFVSGNINLVREAVTCNGVPFMQVAWELQEKYGPVFVLFIFHREFVFICDPVTIKTLLMSTEHSKSKHYKSLYGVYGIRFMGKGLVTEIDHDKWNARRKLYNIAFHRKQLMDLMGDFNTSSDKLVLKLKPDADTDKPVQLMDGLRRTTLDVIAKAAFGISEELILKDSPFIDAVETSMQGMHEQLRYPFDWMNPSRWKFRKQVKKSLLFLRDFGKDIITKSQKEQLEGQHQTNNIVHSILQCFHLDFYKFDMETMVDDFVTFFVAGQETTSNLLGFTILELGKRPDIAKRVQEEIDSIVGDKEFVEYQDVMKMEYTLLVFKEVLRLYPPATGTSRMCAHDLTSCGFHIPAGTSIQMSHYITSRMKQFFKNPLEFDPDRFLRDDDHPMYAYFPFSLGVRSCVGQQFALIEARVILSKLFQKFTFKLDPTQSFAILEQLTLKPKAVSKERDGVCYWDMIRSGRDSGFEDVDQRNIDGITIR